MLERLLQRSGHRTRRLRTPLGSARAEGPRDFVPRQIQNDRQVVAVKPQSATFRCGDRVYLPWRPTWDGRHIGWVAAVDVEPLSGPERGMTRTS